MSLDENWVVEAWPRNYTESGNCEIGQTRNAACVIDTGILRFPLDSQTDMSLSAGERLGPY